MKRQLAKRGIGFEALDNGIMRCDDPDAMQAIAEEVTAPRIDALLRKWLARLPHPFTGADRMAHIRYELSIVQAEFALTQVFDRPVQGRVLFEEVMRENLDLGCCFALCLVGSPRVFVGVFRRRIAWDDGAIREPAGAGGVAFPMNRCCTSGEDVGARAPSVGKRWGSASFSRACPHAA